MQGSSRGHQDFRWFGGGAPADVTGIRAPIKIRKDGALCDASSYPGALDTKWIAIEDTTSSGCATGTCIVQIGEYS